MTWIVDALWYGAAMAFLGSLMLLALAAKVLRRAIKYHDEQKELLMVAEKRVRDKYNQIALQSPKDLENYVRRVFNECLEMVAYIDISERDPDAVMRLYAEGQLRLMERIGNDTVGAIEYYYGENYIDRTCRMYFQLLEKQNLIHRLIHREVTHKELDNAM